MLDVVFREDALKVEDADSAKHRSFFNRASMSVIKLHKGKKDSLTVSIVVQVGSLHFDQSYYLINMSAKWNPALN